MRSEIRSADIFRRPARVATLASHQGFNAGLPKLLQFFPPENTVELTREQMLELASLRELTDAKAANTDELFDSYSYERRDKIRRDMAALRREGQETLAAYRKEVAPSSSWPVKRPTRATGLILAYVRAGRSV